MLGRYVFGTKAIRRLEKDYPQRSVVSYFVYGTASESCHQRCRQWKAWKLHRPPSSCKRIDRDPPMGLGICNPLRRVLVWRQCNTTSKCVTAHIRTRSCHAHCISGNSWRSLCKHLPLVRLRDVLLIESALASILQSQSRSSRTGQNRTEGFVSPLEFKPA